MQSIIKTFQNGKRYGYIYESYRVGKGKDSTVRKRKVYEFGDIDELAKEHPDVKAYMFKARAIYLSTPEHIKGHFEIVYLTLNLLKDGEDAPAVVLHV